MTWLTRFSYFLLALSLAFLSASVFLIHQYKLGIPYPFATNVTLATAVGLGAPLLAVFGFALFVKQSSARQKYFVFFSVCAALGLVVTVITF